jgi:hypothetical protein
MAGLESIALAVDFLEKREGKKETADGNTQPLSFGLGAPPTSAPIPSRSGFLNAPRRVSSDSISEEPAVAVPTPTYSPVNVPPIPSPPREPTVAENMSPEMIARMVENLADDGEFQGTPPPPPSPTEVIARVMDCDVLCGRGGETNHHSGNVKYRSLVKRYQPLYIMSKRRDKPLIASKIVRLVRHMGGRFLRKDKSNTWRDVGNTKAREKTSQALREGAPDLRSPQKGGNKDEQAAVSSPQSSLGVRKHPDFQGGSPCYNSGMGLYASGASIVETHPGEIDRSFNGPAAKKMRVPGGVIPPLVAGGPMQGLPPQFWCGPHHAFLHGMAAPPPAQFMNVSPPTLTLGLNPSLVPPHSFARAAVSFAAAVSADDDDSKSDDRETPRPKPRGPRLKLLKKRLQEEQSGN